MARRSTGVSLALCFTRLLAACVFLGGGLALASTIPTPTTGTSPSGTTATTTPTYTWLPSAGATFYSLRVTDSANVVVFSDNLLSTAAANCAATCFYQPGFVLLADASYTWSVSASNDAGTSAFSPAIAFTPSLSPPEVPSPIAPAGTIATAKPTFSWTASLHAARYDITVSDSSNANAIVQAVSPSDAGCGAGTGTCAFTPSPGLANGTYTWYLYAENESGNAFGGSLPFVVSALPPAPMQVAPSGSVSNGTPQFQWQASVGATSYTLRVQDASGAVIDTSLAPADAGCDGGPTCAFAPPTALANGTYSWWVRAWNPLGHSPWSAGLVITVSVPQPPPVPTASAPWSPVASSVSVGTTPIYVWTLSPLATFYELDVFDFLGNSVLVTTVQPSQCYGGAWCFYSPLQFLPSGNYTWRVTAGNSFGRTASTTASFSVTPFFAPFTPTVVSPRGMIGTSSPTFEWDPSIGAAYYRLIVLDGSSATVFDQTYSALASCNSATCVACATECLVTPALHLPLGSYTWTVAAINNIGSPVSTPTAFTVTTLPAAPPQLGPSGTVTTGTPQFTWLPTVDDCPIGTLCTAGYEVLVQNANGTVIDMTLPVSSSGCPSTSSASCSFTPTSPLANEAYSWFVRALNDAGHSTWSSGQAFIVNAPGGLVPATLVSPTGTVTTATPTFTWVPVAGAFAYSVAVFDSFNNMVMGITGSCPSPTTCTAVSAAGLPNGNYTWQVSADNGTAMSTSARAAFTVNYTPAPPPMPVQVSPSGTLTTGMPQFFWNASDTATSYQWLVQNSSGAQVINTTLDAASFGCSGGGMCGHIPSTTLPNDTYSWWVRAWNALGHSPWSAGLVLVVNGGGLPAAPLQIAPSGTVTTATPTYSWVASSGATSYILMVQNGSGTVINATYLDTDVGCAGGTGTCSITPSTALMNAGVYSWWVRALNASGHSPWSAGFVITVSTSTPGVPAAPVQIGPSGNVMSTTPTYQWMASTGATSYRLLVQGSAGTVVDTTYLPADVGCSTGTTCSIMPGTMLASHTTYSWWVRANNASGHSTWSAGMVITTP